MFNNHLAAADLKIWFKGMKIRYSKLSIKKSGNGTKEHTEGHLDHHHLQLS